jgi:hypothetical protein
MLDAARERDDHAGSAHRFRCGAFDEFRVGITVVLRVTVGRSDLCPVDIVEHDESPRMEMTVIRSSVGGSEHRLQLFCVGPGLDQSRDGVPIVEELQASIEGAFT